MPSSHQPLVLSFALLLSLLWTPSVFAQALVDEFSLIETTNDSQLPDNLDSQVLWIALNLIDEDATREVHHLTGRYQAPPVRESWTTRCQLESPTFVGEALPIGWQSPQPSTQARELDALTCERYLDLKVSGVVGGHHLQDRIVRWQPGLNGSYWLGVPREGTESFEFTFPEIITAGTWVYAPEKSISIQVTPGMHLTSIDVPLRRYAQVLLRSGRDVTEDPRKLFETNVIEFERDNVFVSSNVHPLRAPKGYEFILVDLKPNGSPGGSFQRGVSYSYLDVDFKQGWTYVITLRKRPGLTASSR